MSEGAFPMDVTEERWRFRPQGHLVAILVDAAEAGPATTALIGAGFAAGDVKTYAPEEIVANRERYEEQRTRTDRVVRALVDDAESRDAYLAYALEGRAALWLRVPDETQVPKALRALADVRCLHARHYGRSDVTDYRIAAE